MFINHIDLLNFRSYEELHLELENRINCFVGPNACGKTNLIEAIYYLALTRSFRKANDDALIRFNSDSASVLIDYFDDKSETLRKQISESQDLLDIQKRDKK